MANPNPNWPSFPGVANMAQDADGRPTTQDLIAGEQLGTPLDKAFFDPIIHYLCDLRDALDAENAAAISGVLNLLKGESAGLGLRSDATGQPVFTDQANGQRKLALASQLVGLLSGAAGVPTGGSAGQALFSDPTGQPQYTDGENGTRPLALQSALASLATTTALTAETQRAEAAEAGLLPLSGGTLTGNLIGNLGGAVPQMLGQSGRVVIQSFVAQVTYGVPRGTILFPVAFPPGIIPFVMCGTVTEAGTEIVSTTAVKQNGDGSLQVTNTGFNYYRTIGASDSDWSHVVPVLAIGTMQ